MTSFTSQSKHATGEQNKQTGKILLATLQRKSLILRYDTNKTHSISNFTSVSIACRKNVTKISSKFMRKKQKHAPYNLKRSTHIHTTKNQSQFQSHSKSKE
mmetsp:Transcript_11138/g.16436  ORF Transcript_11138/g.16436 Transcript_11138/m.16436 type:complete len:101 (-) Transcript_11138:31-333(-)